jgi:glycosyltransferase involved in cell wall biosynthesis
MAISVMITTRNRRDDLHRTLTRLLKMNPLPDEILVCVDGCSDDTLDMLETAFPEVKVQNHLVGQGSVVSRDQMLHNIRGDWVLSLDDDSYPLDDDFFQRVLEIYTSHPESAVITFPELRNAGYDLRSRVPDSPGHYVSAYPNCAALMKKDFYLKQTGFPVHFFHAYEEPDYALQCYAAGSSVWFEPSLVIRHHFSGKNRNNIKNHHLHARNELWSVWMRCPLMQLPIVSIFRIWRQFRFAMTKGFSWTIQEPLWWWQAIKGIRSCMSTRRPVPWSIYYAWMRLAREAISCVSELERVFGRVDIR